MPQLSSLPKRFSWLVSSNLTNPHTNFSMMEKNNVFEELAKQLDVYEKKGGEPVENIALWHRDDPENKNNPNPKYELLPCKYFIGKYVKITFSNDVQKEHMWVKVNRVEGDTLHGYLKNDPVFVTTIKCEDPVALHRNQIIEIYKN